MVLYLISLFLPQFQDVDQYNSLDEYLKVVDAYVDILLQNEMVGLSFSSHPSLIYFDVKMPDNYAIACWK